VKDCYLILPEKPSSFLKRMIDFATENIDYKTLDDFNHIPDLKNKKIIFAVELPITGISNSLNSFFINLFERGRDSLKGSEAIVLIHSNYQLYTKTAAQNIIFQSNLLGCRFPGRPLVEATGNLDNFNALVNIYNLPNEEICYKLCRELGNRFINDNILPIENPKIAVIHASNWNTSNTLLLWQMVKDHLKHENILEINVGNGNIVDCAGCPYTTCKHFGQQSKCFYGGIIVEEVYPAIFESDAVIFICPNYNDMISANLVAVINRLTALFRKIKFYDKTLFSIIVSGYSGGDALAKQLISSLNINKTFRLPPYFSLMATANDRGSIKKVPHIEEKAKEFAKNIMREIKK
jgi:multimeric flavodoxin WrbA